MGASTLGLSSAALSLSGPSLAGLMAVDAVPLAPPPRRKGAGLFLTDGRQSVAAGNGLSGGVAGVTAVISVRCRDARNEPQTKGGDVVLVSITPEGGPTTDAHVVDNTDGTYTCTYVPTIASANCRVKVTVNGTHVVGSPFPAQVAPGRTHALASEVFGHGLNDGVPARATTSPSRRRTRSATGALRRRGHPTTLW